MDRSRYRWLSFLNQPLLNEKGTTRFQGPLPEKQGYTLVLTVLHILPLVLTVLYVPSLAMTVLYVPSLVLTVLHVPSLVLTVLYVQRSCTVAPVRVPDRHTPSVSGTQLRRGVVGSLFEGPHSRGTSLGGVPREKQMLKTHLPRVIYHQVY